MMWFTADLHLGDTNILHDMDRPFDSVEEMNRKVIDAINECVAVDDRLYILGDFTYRLPLAEAVRLRERIACQNVTLIRGNHDGDWEDPDVPQIWEDVRDYLEIAPGYAKGHRLVLSHYPMLSWNGKARGAIMLHGHIHSRGDRNNARNRDRERPIFLRCRSRRQRLQARKPRPNPRLLWTVILEPSHKPRQRGRAPLSWFWRRCHYGGGAFFVRAAR